MPFLNDEAKKFQPILSEIGRVITTYSAMEDALKVFVISLIDDYQCYSRITPTELSFPGMINLSTSLYLERFDEDADYEEMQALFSKAADLKGKRDQIAHSEWVSAGTASSVTRIKRTAKQKHGYKTDIENLTIEQIAEVADSLVDLKSQMAAYLNKMVKAGKFFDNEVFPPGT